MTDQQWAEFAAAFPDLLAPASLTPEEMDAIADAYQRAEIASAQSEAAWLANEQEYRK